MSDHTVWHILIIDDEKDILEVMSLAVRDKGYHVLTALDGITGVEQCRKHSPQIVITDIRMPRMNGIKVLEAIKAFNADIEVIVCTAFGEMDLAIQAFQLDASDFITKPVSDEALHLSLERAKQLHLSRKKLKDYARFLEKQASDQAQILHQDKMLSLGRLAASVVHEINNPLSGILNYSRLMSKILRRGTVKADKLEKFRKYLDIVESETARCADIVSSLLAFSRKSSPAMVPVRIQEILEKCIALSRHKMELQNIVLATSIPPELPVIKGDVNQLQQCIINLIFNAIDAMPQGGNLNIDCYCETEKPNLLLRVRDTGIGISQEDLAHIFEPFYTTKQEGYGIGLGLSTVYGIVEHHNGRIDVESRRGHGATFTVRLPVK